MKTFWGAFTVGFLLWILSPAFLGKLEPWDTNLPIYLGVMLSSGAIITFFSRLDKLACATRIFLGVWLGQTVGLLIIAFMQPTFSEARAWWPLGIFSTGIGSTIILLGCLIGFAIRFVYRR